MSVAALLSQLSAARSDTARWKAEARNASATSRQEASEERIRRIAAEARAEQAIASAAEVTAPLTEAKAAKKTAKDAAKALEAELKETKRLLRRTETTVKQLETKVSTIEKEKEKEKAFRSKDDRRSKQSGGSRRRDASANRGPFVDANGASLNTHTPSANETLEHRLVNMQREFNHLRAQLLERNNNNNNNTDDDTTGFPTAMRRPLSPLRLGLGEDEDLDGDEFGANKQQTTTKRKRAVDSDSGSDSDSQQTHSEDDEDDETLAQVAFRVRNEKGSTMSKKSDGKLSLAKLKKKPNALTRRRDDDRMSKQSGGRGGSRGCGYNKTTFEYEASETWITRAREQIAAYLSSPSAKSAEDLLQEWREEVESVGGGTVAHGLCLSLLDVAISDGDGVSDVRVSTVRNDRAWQALACPWWTSTHTRKKSFAWWVHLLLVLDDPVMGFGLNAEAGDDTSEALVDHVAQLLEQCVAAACAGEDPRRALPAQSDASLDERAAVSPAAAVRAAAAAAACVTALRRARLHRGGAASNDIGGIAATRGMVLESLAFGVPGPRVNLQNRTASFGVCPRGATAALSAIAVLASALAVWPEALGFREGKDSIRDRLKASGDRVYEGQKTLEGFEVFVVRQTAKVFASFTDGHVFGDLQADEELCKFAQRATTAIHTIVVADFRANLGVEEGDPASFDVMKHMDWQSTCAGLGDQLGSRWHFASRGERYDRTDEENVNFATAPPTRGALAASAFAGALGGLNRYVRDGNNAQLASTVAETAQRAVAEARLGLTSGPNAVSAAKSPKKKASKASKKAEAADKVLEAKARSHASTLATVLTLIGPAFREGVKIDAGARGHCIDGLAAVVTEAAAGLVNLPEETPETPQNATRLETIAAIGSAAAFALETIIKGKEIKKNYLRDTLVEWRRAGEALGRRAANEAPEKRGQKKATKILGRGSKQPEWDGLKMPEGTVVETV